MAEKAFLYRRSCIGWPDAYVPDLIAMKDAGVPVTRDTFVRHCEVRAVAKELGYVLSGPGLTMARDPHVAYYRSTYKGVMVYFFVWSATEYVFSTMDLTTLEEVTSPPAEPIEEEGPCPEEEPCATE